MKITRKQLNELLRLIARQVLREYSSMSSSAENSSDPGTADDGVKPQDAQTSVEKSKAEHDAKKKELDIIRSETGKLKSVEAQQDYYLQQAKVNKTDIEAKKRSLSAMKGGRTAVVPAGGTVAENIRKIRA